MLQASRLCGGSTDPYPRTAAQAEALAATGCEPDLFLSIQVQKGCIRAWGGTGSWQLTGERPAQRSAGCSQCSKV